MHFTFTSSASAIDNVICIEINLVMKLFVLVKIPCEVGMHCNFTDGKQESAETKL